MNQLIPILADQLSLDLPALQSADLKTSIVVLVEVRAETDYAPHHRQKIWLLFAAMRHFAQKLTNLGFRVHYTRLDDPNNTQNLISEWERLAKLYHASAVILTEAGEYRLKQAVETWMASSSLKISLLEDARFLATHQEFSTWAKGRKQLRMEYFYQQMRKKYKILVNQDLSPLGGKWNFDAENREPLNHLPPKFQKLKTYQDTIITEVKQLVETHFPKHFGELEHLYYAVTAEDAEAHFLVFLEEYLPLFGHYQDVMVEGNPYLFHAVISVYLNLGFLQPLAVCRAAEARYLQGKAPLAAVEGFIRQILGWREYVRGIYWWFMPDYQNLNYFGAKRKLPHLYWGGRTSMHCLAAVVQDTQKYAYSHHIQRLMITGNFALLAGLDPQEVCAWYLGVYIDAYEWVELPNTLGMALFADGGLMASKPYAASAKYIHRMSNFCQSCHYDPNQLLGEKACPFNALYWNFIANHQDLLAKNQRMSYMLATWRRFSSQKQDDIVNHANLVLAKLEEDDL